MKAIKAWAIVQDGSMVREMAGQYDVYFDRAAAVNAIQTCRTIGARAKAIRVEIRETTPKKRGAK